MAMSVSGCSSPRTRRRTSSALTKSGSALANFPWCLVQHRQVVHGSERVGVLLPQDAAADFQRLDQERLGLGELPLVHVQPRQVVHEHERVGVLLPEDAAADFPARSRCGCAAVKSPRARNRCRRWSAGSPPRPAAAGELAGERAAARVQHFLHGHLLVAGVLVRRRLGTAGHSSRKSLIAVALSASARAAARLAAARPASPGSPARCSRPCPAPAAGPPSSPPPGAAATTSPPGPAGSAAGPGSAGPPGTAAGRRPAPAPWRSGPPAPWPSP